MSKLLPTSSTPKNRATRNYEEKDTEGVGAKSNTSNLISMSESCKAGLKSDK